MERFFFGGAMCVFVCGEDTGGESLTCLHLEKDFCGTHAIVSSKLDFVLKFGPVFKYYVLNSI